MTNPEPFHDPRRLHASLLGLSTLIVGPTGLLYALLTGNVMPLYWVACRMAQLGVRLAGVKIEVRGREHLQPVGIISSCPTTPRISIRLFSFRSCLADVPCW